MKIAFTTQDSLYVNAHSGRRSSWIFTTLTRMATPWRRRSRSAANPQGRDGNEDKLEPKMSALQHCTIVYVGDNWPQRGGAG